VDQYCKALIEQVLHEHDILNDCNVAGTLPAALLPDTVIHEIEKSRSAHNYEAIYILQPTRFNVDCIIRDFLDAQNKRYAAARINFISGADDRIIDELRNSPIRPIIRDLTELYLDFNPVESAVFITRSPETKISDSFQILYNPSCRNLIHDELNYISKKVGGVECH
jgi:Sec1 family